MANMSPYNPKYVAIQPPTASLCTVAPQCHPHVNRRCTRMRACANLSNSSRRIDRQFPWLLAPTRRAPHLARAAPPASDRLPARATQRGEIPVGGGALDRVGAAGASGLTPPAREQPASPRRCLAGGGRARPPSHAVGLFLGNQGCSRKKCRDVAQQHVEKDKLRVRGASGARSGDGARARAGGQGLATLSGKWRRCQRGRCGRCGQRRGVESAARARSSASGPRRGPR